MENRTFRDESQWFLEIQRQRKCKRLSTFRKHRNQKLAKKKHELKMRRKQWQHAFAQLQQSEDIIDQIKYVRIIFENGADRSRAIYAAQKLYSALNRHQNFPNLEQISNDIVIILKHLVNYVYFNDDQLQLASCKCLASLTEHDVETCVHHGVAQACIELLKRTNSDVILRECIGTLSNIAHAKAKYRQTMLQVSLQYICFATIIIRCLFPVFVCVFFWMGTCIF